MSTSETDINPAEAAQAIRLSIAAGDLDAHLYAIERAIKTRRSRMNMESGLRKGARVTLTIAGHSLDREQGTVIRVNPKTSTVRLDSGGEYRVPLSMLVVESTRPSEAVMAELARKGFTDTGEVTA